MHIQVITIFPELFAPFTRVGVVGRACSRGLLRIDLADLRDFAEDRHRTVDDRPYGGGAGMVLKADVVGRAIAHCKERSPDAKVVFLTPQGRTLNQRLVHELAAAPAHILVSGRYQGIDQRVVDAHADDEVSIGDYVLSGGELPAMVLAEAMARTLDGVVGNRESVESDSFAGDVLAPPAYTRPACWSGRRVPEILIGGDHERISRWRRAQALRATRRRRPDIAGSGRR